MPGKQTNWGYIEEENLREEWIYDDNEYNIEFVYRKNTGEIIMDGTPLIREHEIIPAIRFLQFVQRKLDEKGE